MDDAPRMDPQSYLAAVGVDADASAAPAKPNWRQVGSLVVGSGRVFTASEPRAPCKISPGSCHPLCRMRMLY